MKVEARRVLGVLAGGDYPADGLVRWVTESDLVIAADGAADRLRSVGVVPDVTIGDLDSLERREDLPHVLHVPDQSTSDADKLLAFAAGEGVTEITLIGIEGDRLDHVLATLASAARSPLLVRLVLRSGIGRILSHGREVTIATEIDDILSLIPLEACTGVFLRGVRWPLEGAEISASGLVSLSNRATSSEVFARTADRRRASRS